MNKKILFALLFLMGSILLTAQTQLGANINGTFFNDNSGASVSMSADGMRVAIGAPSNDGNGENAGQARVFEWNGTVWNLLGSAILGVAIDDNFGMNVSISANGNILAVSAPYNDGNGADSGEIKVYSYNGTDWLQLGNDINGPAGNQLNHISLSADGMRIAVSTPNDNEHGTKSGQVRIFAYNGTTWTQLGNSIFGEVAFDQFGTCLALSSDGNHIAITAPFHDGNATDSGQLRIFSYNGSSWVQMGTSINGEAADDQLGGYNFISYNAVSLSADGMRVAVGAPRNSGNGSEAGQTRVFSFNGTNWQQLGADIDGLVSLDHFGDSVSLSADGNIVAVGASFSDGIGIQDSGQVRLFKYSGSSWTQLGININGDVNFGNFGNSISLSAYAGKIAIGAYHLGSGRGQVKVYDFTTLATTSFEMEQTVVFPNPVQDQLTVQFFEGVALEKINLYTVTGQFLQSYTTNTINIQGFPQGIYFVEIVSDKGKTTKKIIIN